MADNITVSGTTDPYNTGVYSAPPNEKNTLTVTSFIKLLAAQLANQDMSNPMDNSEMMAQMTQMAMVQSMGAMTDSITTSTAVTSQTYAAGLVGQMLTVAVTEEGPNGLPVPVGVKYGEVVSVDLTSGVPVLKLKDDNKEYPLSYVLGIGKIDDPYKKEDEDEKVDGKPDEKNDGKTDEKTDVKNDGENGGVDGQSLKTGSNVQITTNSDDKKSPFLAGSAFV